MIASKPKVTTTQPKAQIITIGTKPIGESVPFKTEYQADDNLEKGKTRKRLLPKARLVKKKKANSLKIQPIKWLKSAQNRP